MRSPPADLPKIGPSNPVRLEIAPRRGLARDEAARYIGIGVTKFDELVRDGRMPQARRVDGRKVWDIRALDMAFEALPVEDSTAGNSWQDARAHDAHQTSLHQGIY